MLKKLGIVAATATAGLIALSPLAFATDKGHDHGYGADEVTNVWIEDESVQRDQINDCEFDQDIESSGLLGITGVVTQAQTDNCVNIGDTTEDDD